MIRTSLKNRHSELCSTNSWKMFHGHQNLILNYTNLFVLNFKFEICTSLKLAELFPIGARTSVYKTSILLECRSIEGQSAVVWPWSIVKWFSMQSWLLVPNLSVYVRPWSVSKIIILVPPRSAINMFRLLTPFFCRCFATTLVDLLFNDWYAPAKEL